MKKNSRTKKNQMVHKHLGAKRIIAYVTALCFGVGFLLNMLPGPKTKTAKPTKPTQPAQSAKQTRSIGQSIQPQTLDTAIDLAAQYLLRQAKKSGQFIYRINLNPKVRVPPKYNMLRHAGSIYALAMYTQTHPNKAMKHASQQAGRFLVEQSVGPLPDLPQRDDLLAIWTKSAITHNQRKPLQAKLGGSGLGLVALLSLEQQQLGVMPIGDLRKLGNFIIEMQKDDGGFYSKYIPSQGGKQDKWVSLYYPGEAALGLVYLYQIDPSNRWLDASANALAFLARTRQGQTKVPADHWALLATAKLLALKNVDEKLPVKRKLLMDHVAQICNSILNEQVGQEAYLPQWAGGFSPDGRTTPTSTRLEGLLAALTILPQEHDALKKRIASSVHQAMAFLLTTQVRSGPAKGAFPRALRKVPTYFPNAIIFNKRSTEIRIDYVQHAMCAMIQYRDWQKQTRRPTMSQSY